MSALIPQRRPVGVRGHGLGRLWLVGVFIIAERPIYDKPEKAVCMMQDWIEGEAVMTIGRNSREGRRRIDPYMTSLRMRYL